MVTISSADTFTRYFTKYGKIVDAVIMRDRATGQPRGFGFVTFEDPDVCDSVVKDKHVLDGREVFQFSPTDLPWTCREGAS